MKKLAIVQTADTGPLESLAVMLGSVGYDCMPCSQSLNGHLRSLGMDTVLDIDDLVRTWGYESPFLTSRAQIHHLRDCDLFVDVKAHRNGPLLWKTHSHLKNKTLWYRINGGKPEHVIQNKGRPEEFDCGDEVNPPCPVLTPNQWYGHGWVDTTDYTDPNGKYVTKKPCPAYGCWPPFHRVNDYLPKLGRPQGDNLKYGRPVCLIHQVKGWGYGKLIPEIHNLGVEVYGRGSPGGLVNHRQVPQLLAETLAMVHLKSNDAPGYALYEALAAGCPIILPRRMIWRCKMQDLFIPNETCLVFDRETHEGLTDQDVLECKAEIGEHLEALKDPKFNTHIGFNGRAKLLEIMWSQNRTQDVVSLQDFFTRNFP